MNAGFGAATPGLTGAATPGLRWVTGMRHATTDSCTGNVRLAHQKRPTRASGGHGLDEGDALQVMRHGKGVEPAQGGDPVAVRRVEGDVAGEGGRVAGDVHDAVRAPAAECGDEVAPET